jgi:hypothetical protein
MLEPAGPLRVEGRHWRTEDAPEKGLSICSRAKKYSMTLVLGCAPFRNEGDCCGYWPFSRAVDQVQGKRVVPVRPAFGDGWKCRNLPSYLNIWAKQWLIVRTKNISAGVG